MNISWNTPISELMHSDTTPPLGLIESDEELMHWKYIKRERKNGRWVYYYDTEELEKHGKIARGAELRARTALKKTGRTGAEVDAAYEKYKKTRGLNSINLADYFAGSKREKAARLARKYERKKIISLPRRVIAKGMTMLLNQLSGNGAVTNEGKYRGRGKKLPKFTTRGGLRSIK